MGAEKIGASLREATSNTRRYAEWTVFGRRLPPLPTTSDWQQRQRRAAMAAVAAVAAAAAAAATVWLVLAVAAPQCAAVGCGSVPCPCPVPCMSVHVRSAVPCGPQASPMHGRASDRDAGRLILQGIYVLGCPIGHFFLASASRPARPVRSVDT